MRNARLPLAALVAALVAAGCSQLRPCASDLDCGPAASCAAGSCVALDQTGPGGEGEPDEPPSFDALVVLPGVDALVGRTFTLPLPLDPAELAMEPVGVDGCTVALTAVDAAATFPVSLLLTCAELHLGALVLPLSLTGAAGDVEVSLTVRLVPSDWLDLERSERELITVDTNGLLHQPTAAAGAPVFLAADRIPAGALDAGPRLIAIEGGAPVDVAFELDGGGLWFALPASGRLWLYYAPVTGTSGTLLTAAPWDRFAGVWHLEDGADASTADGADDLEGTATPTAGVIGGAAGFDGADALAAPLATSPERGAMSAWLRLAPATAGIRQVAVGAGCEEAEGAFDPEGITLYADVSTQACGFVGAGEGEAVTQQCSTGSPAALANDAWHHVAVTWNGSARELIVDGEAYGAQTGPTPSAYDLEALSIGSALDLDDPWIGDVDEVRYAADALPASWFQVEHASVTGLTTDAGRPFVLGLRPDVLVASEVVTSDGAPLAPVPVVPSLSRGVLVAFVAARGASADGARFDDVALSRLAPSAEGSDLSLTALSYEGNLDGAPLTVMHAGAVPPLAVVGTLAFPGGTERGLAGVDLAAEPVVVAGPQLALAAAPASAGAAWIVVAVASRKGVSRCDACGRHVLGPIEGGAGLVLDVFAGEREPTAHVLEPIVAGDDAAAVVVVRVGP